MKGILLGKVLDRGNGCVKVGVIESKPTETKENHHDVQP